ncbi:DUF192 domain-containing protein [Candidatus Nanosalina sp. VS9-1]|uniref:DUF192 domain-containing protein n=1 Tax=Candidatus Nanosalina sp. VS9-1 TaxID=3388566 RepID=UPI0039E0E2E2
MTEEIEIEASREVFEAELADSLLKKSWGLSMRKEGKMLFVFGFEERPPIDMMLVQRPLNLYFLDDEKKVVDVQYAEPWSFDPRTWRIYRPSVDSSFLLESFEDLELEEGDQLRFDV